LSMANAEGRHGARRGPALAVGDDGDQRALRRRRDAARSRGDQPAGRRPRSRGRGRRRRWTLRLADVRRRSGGNDSRGGGLHDLRKPSETPTARMSPPPSARSAARATTRLRASSTLTPRPNIPGREFYLSSQRILAKELGAKMAAIADGKAERIE